MQILAGVLQMGLKIGVNAKKMKTRPTNLGRAFTQVFWHVSMTHKQRTRRRPGDPLADTPTYTCSARLYKKYSRVWLVWLAHITGIFGSDLLANASRTAIGEKDCVTGLT